MFEIFGSSPVFKALKVKFMAKLAEAEKRFKEKLQEEEQKLNQNVERIQNEAHNAILLLQDQHEDNKIKIAETLADEILGPIFK